MTTTTTAATTRSMLNSLAEAGITTRKRATALTITERDRILGVAAWSADEDVAWADVLDVLGPVHDCADLGCHDVTLTKKQRAAIAAVLDTLALSKGEKRDLRWRLI